MSDPVQLQPDEDVIMTIKRHPIHLWGKLALIIIIVALILALWLSFGMSQTGFVGTFMNILAIGSVVVGVIMGYVYWYRYNNDLWLITSQRLVDSTKSTPFAQRSAYCRSAESCRISTSVNEALHRPSSSTVMFAARRHRQPAKPSSSAV